MKKHWNLKILFIVGFILLASASMVFANNNWEMETNWPDSPIPGGQTLQSDSNIAELVAYFYEWGIVIGIIIFFIMLLFAGFEYLTSAGNPSRLESARRKIISGFAGVFLLMGSFLILNTINPELTQISKIEKDDIDANFEEFQSGLLGSEENMCDFAFVWIQDEDEEDPIIRFLIPGMTIETPSVRPVKSIACIPEKDEDEILEIREVPDEEDPDRKNLWLVKRISGEVIDKNASYSDRYEYAGSVTVNSTQDVYDYLLLNRKKNLLNIFDNCSDLIDNPKFNRPRCLQVSDNGTITEWKRIGFASFVKAWREIGNKNEINKQEAHCPNQIPGETLGYERATGGGGCSLALYGGETRPATYLWLRKIPTCDNQISRPSADMDHFDGIVDKSVNCIELIRHDPPLDLE